MRDTNYFTIQYWMVSKLKLRGVERDVYAIIYGFTQDNDTECKCSLNWMSELTGHTKKSIVEAINNLESNNLIIRINSTSNTDRRNSYRCNYDIIDELDGVERTPSWCRENTIDGVERTPHNINKNKNSLIKSTGAGASSKNHSQVYKQRNTLSDDLESGKDIDEQKKSKKKSPKDKFRDECLDIIEKQFVMYPAHISDLLADYFDFISAVPDDKENLPKRVKTVSSWKKKLHKLVELVSEGYDIEKLIQQSLDNKAYVFYPLQSTQSKSKSTGHREGNQENVVMSDPEYIRKRLEEDESEEWY